MTDRMKLNWFSPLPPDPTGVAEYASHVLPALCDRADVVVWNERGAVEGLDPRAELRFYQIDAIPWWELNDADLSIYHIGNNCDYHRSPWLVSRRHPGVVVLHDLSLPDFFIGFYRQRANGRAEYIAAMERHHSLAGRGFAVEYWEDRLPGEYMAERCPLTDLALEGAAGVLVHTPAAYEEMKPRRRWPLAYHPLAYRVAAPPARKVERTDEPYRLVVFGHISGNRRLEAIMEALAGLPERGCFHLHVFGSLWDPKRIEAKARTPALRSCVTVHGYVDDEVLEAALARAHLAINLRYPTMGEGSISQLRIWKHALPTLVSEVGWYASLPAEAVAFVRPRYEVEDVRRHLRAFLADPEAFARRGAEGRRYLTANHAPEMYAAALLDLCREARGHRRRSLGYYLAERAGGEMALWCPDREAARPVADTIARLVA